MNKLIDTKLRYSVIIDHRSIVAAICINELQFLMKQVDFTQDRQLLESMICGCERLVNTDVPLKLDKVCNLLPTCNTCCDKCR